MCLFNIFFWNDSPWSSVRILYNWFLLTSTLRLKLNLFLFKNRSLSSILSLQRQDRNCFNTHFWWRNTSLVFTYRTISNTSLIALLIIIFLFISIHSWLSGLISLLNSKYFTKDSFGNNLFNNFFILGVQIFLKLFCCLVHFKLQITYHCVFVKVIDSKSCQDWSLTFIITFLLCPPEVLSNTLLNLSFIIPLSSSSICYTLYLAINWFSIITLSKFPLSSLSWTWFSLNFTLKLNSCIVKRL